MTAKLNTKFVCECVPVSWTAVLGKSRLRPAREAMAAGPGILWAGCTASRKGQLLVQHGTVYGLFTLLNMVASDELHGFELAVDLLDNSQHGEAS